MSYEWLTPFYDPVVRLTTREKVFKNALVSEAQIKIGHRVLDLACGTGTLTILIKNAQTQTTVIGIDGDSTVLDIARAKAKDSGVEIEFDEGMSFELPYEDASVDRVDSSLFFHHLLWEDKVRTAHELFRVLKPGAVLHVADWGRAANPVMRGLFLFIQLLDGFDNTRDNVAGKLITLFEDAGFTAETQRQTFGTVYGTMALYSATRPAGR